MRVEKAIELLPTLSTGASGGAAIVLNVSATACGEPAASLWMVKAPLPEPGEADPL
jgi:hypothetical protein